MKKITIEEYFESLMQQENSEREQQFIDAQENLNKNISADVLKLVKSLTAGNLNPPADFVFMVYFRVLWGRIESFYGDKDLDDLKGLFKRLMDEGSEIEEQVLQTDRHTLN